MGPMDPHQRLDRISTLWSVVSRSQGGAPEEVSAAQRELLQRYGPAVHRYLLVTLRDPEAADELAQEFARRCIRGDLRGARPDRGRFRHFVKGVLSHLIADHYRRRQKEPRPLSAGAVEPAAPDEAGTDRDREFLDNWRGELLTRAWDALAEIQRRTGNHFYAVLHARAGQPNASSAEMAELLAARLGKPVTRDRVRQTLHRAREKFTDLLVNEVLATLEQPTVEGLEQELIDLGLLEYCRPVLQRYRDNA